MTEKPMPTKPEIFTVEHLEACPKCGSDDIGVFRLTEVYGLQWYALQCRACHYRNNPSTSFDETVNDWNRRASNA